MKNDFYMKMNVTFVTAFLCPTNGNPIRSLDAYLKEFNYLVNAGVPLLVYLDEAFPERIPGAEQIRITRDWVPNDPILPSTRNPNKDTVDYFCIQAMKLELLAKSVSKCTTPYLAWIDFGVFHMIQAKEEGQATLRDLSTRTYPTNKLIAPGCWPHGEYGLDSVCWRFCGSFVLGHRDLFAPAYQRQQELFQSISPALTWEVNIWSRMDDMFYMYSADHNDSLFSVPDYKMRLCDLVDNSATDKNTQHSYLDTYELLFSPHKESATHVLELGIGGHAGGLKLFRDYFPNAQIHGVDILPRSPLWGNDPRITIHSETNGYSLTTLNQFGDTKFDVIVDDGPHTLESMVFVVSKYSALLKEGGVLVVEDVPQDSWIPILQNATPQQYSQYVKVYDLRPKKNQFDDILFVINTGSQDTAPSNH